jgi:hypothetical protein
MNFKAMSARQTFGWYFSGAIYGLCVLVVAVRSGFLYDEDMRIPAAVVFGISWIIGVIGLRLYLQNVDLTDFWSILGLKKK